MVAMTQPETGNTTEALKDASLNYCIKLLQNSNVDPEFKDEIWLENLLHNYRMMENCKADDELSHIWQTFRPDLTRLVLNAAKYTNFY